MAMVDGGELWSAGCNESGQLGIGNTTRTNSFVKADLGDTKTGWPSLPVMATEHDV